MGLFDGCLLACDIDGTLVSNGYINPVNIEKINYFMEQGGLFSLSTGRGISAVFPILRQLKKVSPSVVANGAVIYDFENKTALSQRCLPKCDYRITELLSRCDGLGIEVHSGLDTLVIRKTQETEDHEIYEELTPIDTDYATACERDWNKAIFLCKDIQQREELKKIIAKEDTESNFVETSAVIYGRMRYYYEQVPKGVSKLTALKKLCEMNNIKKGGFFAIGDYYNDLDMIKNADIGAAVEESPDDIKAHARYVAVGCADGAVADFIDYLSKRNTK